jgi:hypothetical protein
MSPLVFVVVLLIYIIIGAFIREVGDIFIGYEVKSDRTSKVMHDVITMVYGVGIVIILSKGVIN